MERKVFQKIIALVLVLCMTAANFIFVGVNAVYALSNSTELEGGNIQFKAYYKGLTENNEVVNTQTKSADVREGEVLYISLKVAQGRLQNGKVNISNGNFKIDESKLENNYVKKVTENGLSKVIELNDISYADCNGNAIEIAIPVKFEEKSKIDVAYFEMSNKITLSGKYYNSSENGKDVTSNEIETNLKWHIFGDGLAKREYNPTVEKIIYLENATVIQASVTSTITENYFPKEIETISFNLPKVNEITPTYSILVNGDKIDSSKLTVSEDGTKVSYTNNFINNGQITWDKNGDTYKIIYVYQGLTKLENKFPFNAHVNTKIFDLNKVTDKDLQLNPNVEKGVIASVTAKATSTDVYKGYMYANSNNTEYKETYNMELSYVDGVTAELNLKEDYFKTETENQSTNNNTEYKEIVFNKVNLLKVLGTTGSVVLTPSNTELDPITINKDTRADENGNIVIGYEKISNSHNVKIEVLSAQNEGTLKIDVTKQIKGNAGYNKETINTFNAIETTIESRTNKDKELKSSTATATTELKETTTEATLTMNNNNRLSTVNTNQVEFIATLKTGTMSSDLLKDPTIRIQLPDEVKNIEVTSVSVLYAENNLKEEQPVVENKAILVKLDGEQITTNNSFVEGIKVTINANITLDDFASSRNNAEVVMTYTNQNSVQGEFTKNIPVSIVAPEKVLTKTRAIANFEQFGKGTEKITVVAKNNLASKINNFALVGEVAGEIKAENIVTRPENTPVEIKYSQDKTTWGDTLENAKYFKVTLANKEIEVSETVGLQLTYDCATTMKNFDYTFARNGMNYSYTLDNIDIQTNEPAQEEVEPTGEDINTEKLTLNVAVVAANQEITNNDVYENQVIRYTYTIKNTSNEDVTDVKLTANHENTNVFDIVEEQQLNTANPYDENNNENNKTFTFERETDSSRIVKEIGTIHAGEIKIVTYQVRVKTGVEKINSQVVVTANGIDNINYQSTNNVKSAELSLELTNNRSNNFPVQKDGLVPNIITIKNNTDNLLEDVIVNLTIPKEFNYYDLQNVEQNNDFTIITNTSNLLSFKINKIASKNSKSYQLTIKMVEENPEKDSVKLKYMASTNNNEYTSNEVEFRLQKVTKSLIEATLNANIQDEIVKTGDKLTYTINLKNTGDIADSLIVSDYVPVGAVVTNAYVASNGEQTTINNIENNHIFEEVVLNPGEEKQIVIETEINEELTGREIITNKATIDGLYLENEIETNEVTKKLQANIKPVEEDDPTDPSDPTNPDDPSSPSNPDSPSTPGEVDVKQSISGMVWLDSNKNGIKENSEKRIAGVKVMLADIKANDFVKDNRGKIIEVITNENGEYKFENIPDGKYMVVFAFDIVKYRNTEFHASNATDATNSDIIIDNTRSDDTKLGLTDTLVLNQKSIENIDAGLIENEVFDLTLNKYVSKVTVQNSSGTTVKQYNKQQIAKLEIDSKNLAGSTLLVEYEIAVKNIGEIAGYANEIIDYIPNDLSFNSELNNNWYMSTDGNLHTTTLAKDLIEPGETKTVKLVLTKTMTENNTGLTTNKAEIVKESNELLIPDKDTNNSTSTADLIVSIRTGVEFTIGIIITLITLSATGIIIYSRIRKEASHE